MDGSSVPVAADVSCTVKNNDNALVGLGELLVLCFSHAVVCLWDGGLCLLLTASTQQQSYQGVPLLCCWCLSTAQKVQIFSFSLHVHHHRYWFVLLLDDPG